MVTDSRLLVVCAFNSGRHRSVAVANLLAGSLDQLGGEVEELFLANYGSWIDYGCARDNGVECAKCRFREAGTEAQAGIGIDYENLQ